MMPSFDLLLDHLAARETGSSSAAPRPAGRIIAAEQLGEVMRFAMRPLTPAGSPRPSGRATDETTAPDAPPHAAPGHHSDPDAAGATADVWQPEYASGHKAGLAEGFRRGFDAGVAHANAKRDEEEEQAGGDLAGRLESLAADFQHQLGLIEQQAADRVIALALDVARHALRATLAVQPEAIIPVVQEALAGIIDESVRLHLYLNPRDEALIRAELGAKLSQSGCEIVADPSVRAGGCRIVTARAEVDATVQTRWRRTLAALGHAPDSDTAPPHDRDTLF